MPLAGTSTAPVISQVRCRFTSSDVIRRRALARLYERRVAVDQLISSLERYQRDQACLRVLTEAISAETK